VPFFRVEAAFLSPCHSEKADQSGEFCESTEAGSLPRHQFTMASFDMCQGSEAVDLQFQDKLFESKGSSRRDSRVGRRFWINIKRGFYPDPLDSIVISYPVRSAEY
jgi:hypothetical protein